ncbi:MAG: thiamine diphosphokinase [Candidatus Eremiobacteraeota bacterium]|nr:thiamine diphosphokinase [Candidatus Eremiobacteraeota bacterium]MCW5869139.1 thiamine diphosphokinase [Candidatus Eremiobacteraeota bacterium]
MSENPAAIIVAGGPSPPVAWARPLLEKASLLFCADSGLHLCLACGLQPDMLVGDLDSVGPEQLGRLPDLRYGVEQHNSDKDESDLDLTLRALARYWQGPVDILAALGGRLDHALFNLCAVLFQGRQLGLRVRLLDPETIVYPLENEFLELHDLVGATCSILPLGGPLGGVTLQGFRYPLRTESLGHRQTRGLSNRIDVSPASIQAQSGQALVVISQKSHLC